MDLNKLNIEDEITLEDGTFYLNIDKVVNIKINVLENTRCKLFIVGINDYNLDIKVLNNSEFTINSLNKDNSVNVKIDLMEKAKIVYNHSVSAYNNSVNKFVINHLENSSTSILNNNGINRHKNRLYFEIDGVIKKELKNINCNQSSKIINFDKGDSKIIPNLIIDSNDIVIKRTILSLSKRIKLTILYAPKLMTKDTGIVITNDIPNIDIHFEGLAPCSIKTYDFMTSCII